MGAPRPSVPLRLIDKPEMPSRIVGLDAQTIAPTPKHLLKVGVRHGARNRRASEPEARACARVFSELPRLSFQPEVVVRRAQASRLLQKD